jgi:hypothetical protein
MSSKCVECDHLLADDEVEYLYKGKSFCDDCYRAVKKLRQSKRSKFPFLKNLIVLGIKNWFTDLPLLYKYFQYFWYNILFPLEECSEKYFIGIVKKEANR